MADYRHVYHVEGVTDRETQTAAARKHGGVFIVHEHAKGALCTDQCQAHWPDRKPASRKATQVL